ncbi:MAG: ATP-binding cassette domain-containing protein, partial [Candidatus Marinimicrobia bacterium]|nr:ATP-binding cassette domain-containing protein [Candidatus Neomarinimicrobiota bacterium]
MLLSLQNVSLKSYNRNIETTFLDSINLDIESGEAIGIIGETGSGKTMLAWTILDQLPIARCVVSGRMFFNNKEITQG